MNRSVLQAGSFLLTLAVAGLFAGRAEAQESPAATGAPAEEPASASPEPSAPPPPAPAAPTPPAAAAGCNGAPCETPPPEEKESDGGGLFGPFRVGPIVGVGFPNFLNYGVTAKLAKIVGVGINAGHIFDTRMPLMGEASVSYNEIDLYGRLYPFAGGFFVGAGVGYETARGTLSKSAKSLSGLAQLPPGLSKDVNIASTGSVKALILTPQLGWLWSFDFGLAIGVDVGAQIPIAPSQISMKTTVPSSVPEPVRTTIRNTANATLRDTLKTVGKTPLPMMNLRIGWLF
jgi:hypothetical protein